MFTYYLRINKFYKGKKANRSGVPYMQHIDEGLAILRHIKATDNAMAAYCMHPMFQTPDTLRQTMESKEFFMFDPYIVTLAMEYRNKANAYLCRPKTDNYTLADLPVMVLPEVTDMLIADKIQNYKDFLLNHKGKHERSDQLDNYFKTWLTHLQLSKKDIKDLIKVTENFGD